MKGKSTATDILKFAIITTATIAAALIFAPHEEVVTPIPDNNIVLPTPTPYLFTPTPTQYKKVFKGKASYYSRSGCLGCSKTLTMRNGEPLDDTKLTLAFNHLPMNTIVTVTNTTTGSSVRAKVSDTGGFHKYNRIADLSVATKQAIGCADLCDVEVAE